MRSLRMLAYACVCAGILSINTAPSAAATAPPPAPGDLQAIPGIGQVALQWTEASGAESYNIHYKSVSGADGSEKSMTGVRGRHATVTGLRSKQEYLFKVEAVAGKVIGGSSEVKATTDEASFKPETVQAFFQAGASLLNPYHLKTDAGVTTVEAATKTDANAFLEFVYANRLAWNGKKIEEYLQKQSARGWRWPWFTWDVEARIGYTFAKGNDSTANTIVGSGDFSAELAASTPFYLKQADSRKYNFSYGLEFGYSTVTERSALKAHDSWFAGLSYNASFEDPFGAVTKEGIARHALLNFRMLYATVDTIRYIDDNDALAQIETRNGFPKYHQKWTVTFQSELLYPLNDASYLTFSGRVYPDTKPGLWSMQIGFTIVPTKMLKSLQLE